MPIPDFVRRLREHVGTEELWLPGVSAVILDHDGRLLLGRRSDNGLWAVVSGILEPGEQPATAVVREAAEETGVVVEVVALTMLRSEAPVSYPNGDSARYLDACFWCRAVGGEARVGDDESTAVAWFEPAALPADLTASSADRIARTLDFISAQQAGQHPAPWFER